MLSAAVTGTGTDSRSSPHIEISNSLDVLNPLLDDMLMSIRNSVRLSSSTPSTEPLSSVAQVPVDSIAQAPLVSIAQAHVDDVPICIKMK